MDIFERQNSIDFGKDMKRMVLARPIYLSNTNIESKRITQ